MFVLCEVNINKFISKYKIMGKYNTNNSGKRTSLLYFVVIPVIFFTVSACNKSNHSATAPAEDATLTSKATQYQQGALQTKVVTVLGVNPIPGGATNAVMFRELQEGFVVGDPVILAKLTTAMNANEPVKITFDPWSAAVISVNTVTSAERAIIKSRQIISSPGSSRIVDLANTDPDLINNISAAPEGAVNTTSSGLTDVIPDMATAQLMFDYITHQCCALPGPYTIDYCITFQYCEDGCYARAHKMCYIMNNKYHYATHKIFSFAYPDGPHTLSVKGEKWGGCCINWWYHVAPLVNIKTSTGVQAYVFDPAMFDQPVLLYTWLHAQENPACEGSEIPQVTSYNLQPTSSYAPNDTSSFVTDPYFADTDTTLVHYKPLVTCP